MPIRRSDSSAGRAVRLLCWFAICAGFVLLVKYLPGENTPIKYLILAGWVAYLIFGPPVDSTVSSLAKAWAPRVKDNDLLWRIARLVLAVDTIGLAPFRFIGRTIRRTMAWFATTTAGRFVDRNRRRLAIILTVLITYRLVTLAGLIALGGQATILHWAVFGLGYGLFGATAPFVALLAILTRREWAVVTFVIWHLIAPIGVLLAFTVAWYAAMTGGGAPHYAASPGLLAGELLLHLFALRWFGPIKRAAASGSSQPTTA